MTLLEGQLAVEAREKLPEEDIYLMEFWVGSLVIVGGFWGVERSGGCGGESSGGGDAVPMRKRSSSMTIRLCESPAEMSRALLDGLGVTCFGELWSALEAGWTYIGRVEGLACFGVDFMLDRVIVDDRQIDLG